MAIVKRMRAVMLPQYEKALQLRRERIDAFFDQQIADAQRKLQGQELIAAIDSLMKAKTEQKRRVTEEIVAQGGYTESFLVTLENDVAEQRSAENLFNADDFPPKVRAVNMAIRSVFPSTLVNGSCGMLRVSYTSKDLEEEITKGPGQWPSDALSR